MEVKQKMCCLWNERSRADNYGKWPTCCCIEFDSNLSFPLYLSFAILPLFPGDIDDCIVTPTVQGHFTPLPEALCDVIMDLTSQGQSATIENIRVKLSVRWVMQWFFVLLSECSHDVCMSQQSNRFSHMQQPNNEMIYDSLAQLMQEKKIYQTAKGYFIVTPEWVLTACDFHWKPTGCELKQKCFSVDAGEVVRGLAAGHSTVTKIRSHRKRERCSWRTPKLCIVYMEKFQRNAMAIWRISASKRIWPMSFAEVCATIFLLINSLAMFSIVSFHSG